MKLMHNSMIVEHNGQGMTPFHGKTTNCIMIKVNVCLQLLVHKVYS